MIGCDLVDFVVYTLYNIPILHTVYVPRWVGKQVKYATSCNTLYMLMILVPEAHKKRLAPNYPNHVFIPNFTKKQKETIHYI